MIYWTPLDLDQVFKGWDQPIEQIVDMEYDGLLVQVNPIGNGKARLVRLISGNPMDYLRPELTPGTIVAMN